MAIQIKKQRYPPFLFAFVLQGGRVVMLRRLTFDADHDAVTLTAASAQSSST